MESKVICRLVLGGWDETDRLSNLTFLSLGTGEMTRPIMYEEAKGWGLAKCAQPILSVAFDGVSDTVDYQVKSLLEIESTSRTVGDTAIVGVWRHPLLRTC